MGNRLVGGTGGRVTSGRVNTQVGLGQSIPSAVLVGPVHPEHQQQQEPQPRATTTRINRDASEAEDDDDDDDDGDNVVGVQIHGGSSVPLDEQTSGGQDNQNRPERRARGGGIGLSRSPELVVVASRRAVSFQLPSEQRTEPVGLRLYRQAIRRLADTDWVRDRLPSVARLLRETANPPRRSRRHPCRTRPISRLSRRRWHQSADGSGGGQLLKTCWPVRQTEGLFLPLFPVDERRQHQYDREAHLGDGAFGRVYRVRDTEHTGTHYALKLLRKSNILDSDGVRQLQDEVSIQRLCGHHPFIVGCLDFWQTRTHIFLLSIYYGNGELFQRVKYFSSELIRLYIAELALALDFLHNAGIIYRDLKSENLLLDDRFHLKLIDFGLSRWLSVGSYTRTFCGTVQYMAPELLSGDPYGHAVDWWALGVLACRMYTGQFPNVDATQYLCQRQDAISVPRSKIPSVKLGAPLIPEPNDPVRRGAIPVAGRDLLQRLLQPVAKDRLRSLLQLQRIALYQHYRWDAVRATQIDPRQFITDECLGGALEEASGPGESFAGF
ncbi:serine/threonine-protein kinase S6KL [Anopheles aquasalis]|uniref:serine/threonine-protein kinase S6KL n=1 Tax=Anopheles aquasalis TaxID=42839 RepID=UPI00215A8E2F|nr:serine/threonine-protein kinase S6KL [Anopheles aquasalis]